MSSATEFQPCLRSVLQALYQDRPWQLFGGPPLLAARELESTRDADLWIVTHLDGTKDLVLVGGPRRAYVPSRAPSPWLGAYCTLSLLQSQLRQHKF